MFISSRPPENLRMMMFTLDIEPDTGVLTTKVVDDISNNSKREVYVHVPNVLPTHSTLYPVFDTLLLFYISKIRDKGHSYLEFDLILISNLLDQIKYRGSSQAQDSVNKNKRFDCPDFEDSRALGFVHRLLDLQWESNILDIPSGESKVHIEVLSVLWGNRQLISDGSLPLSSNNPDDKKFAASCGSQLIVAASKRSRKEFN
ncbi:hypothetical protein Tco_0216097 [Tanacetum coccineum]